MVSGRARGFFALVTDVSSLKRAQLSLLEMDRKLQASERLVSLGTLAAGIAHEINSPLTSVSVNGAVSSVDPQLAVRFVFMTGGAFTDDGRRFLSAVSAPVIEKPFEVSRIRQLLAAAPGGGDRGSDADLA